MTQRVIEFRGKTRISNRWIFGNVILGKDHANIYPVDSNTDYEVKPDTVGQFTGLNDKHGNKIFEGDIVRHNKLGVFSAEFKDGSFRMGIVLLNFFHKEIEVIGNIFDNPELINNA